MALAAIQGKEKAVRGLRLPACPPLVAWPCCRLWPVSTSICTFQTALQGRTPLDLAVLHNQRSAAKVLRGHINRFDVHQYKRSGVFGSYSLLELKGR